MKALIISSFIILVSYVIAVCKRWGMPKSVSRTYFDIKRKYIFSLVMFVSFGLIIVPLLEALPEAYKIFGFLTCAGGFFVGAAPNLNEQMEHKVHMSGAITLAVASQVCVGVIEPKLLWAWVASIPILLIYRNSIAFWVEMFGGTLLYISLYLSL